MCFGHPPVVANGNNLKGYITILKWWTEGIIRNRGTVHQWWETTEMIAKQSQYEIQTQHINFVAS